MDKLLLTSIIAANVLIPVWASRDPFPKRGLRKAIVGILAFNTAYVYGLFYVLPRLVLW